MNGGNIKTACTFKAGVQAAQTDTIPASAAHGLRYLTLQPRNASTIAHAQKKL